MSRIVHVYRPEGLNSETHFVIKISGKLDETQLQKLEWFIANDKISEIRIRIVHFYRPEGLNSETHFVIKISGKLDETQLQKLEWFLANDKISEIRSEEHTSELQSLRHLVCRLLLEKKKTT